MTGPQPARAVRRRQQSRTTRIGLTSKLLTPPTERADDYIFATVFFATVLFFAGISMHVAWWPMRLTVLTLGAMSFLYGLV
jgi:hypothetical protein